MGKTNKKIQQSKNRATTSLKKQSLVSIKKSTQPKRNTLLKKFKSQRLTAQPISSKTMKTLLNHIEKNNQIGFSTTYRASSPHIDELISCKITFSRCKKILNNTKTLQSKGVRVSEIKNFLNSVNKIRLPIAGTVHRVQDDKGTELELVHPGEKGNHAFGAPLNNSKRERSIGHTSFNNARDNYVDKGKTKQELIDRAIEFTLNHVQPMFAGNSVEKVNSDDPYFTYLDNSRNELKKKVSLARQPKTTQNFQAKFIPGSLKGFKHRSLSPVRTRSRRSARLGK